MESSYHVYLLVQVLEKTKQDSPYEQNDCDCGEALLYAQCFVTIPTQNNVTCKTKLHSDDPEKKQFSALFMSRHKHHQQEQNQEQ